MEVHNVQTNKQQICNYCFFILLQTPVIQKGIAAALSFLIFLFGSFYFPPGDATGFYAFNLFLHVCRNHKK